jgi:capsular exopolysaccharide synthesis family protein
VANIDGKAKAQYQKSIDAAQEQVDKLTAEIKGLSPGDPSFDSKQRELDDANNNVSTAERAGAPTSGLQSVQSAAAVASDSGTSRTKRALIAGLVGLLIGTGLALLLTRFDTRLHSREAVDEAFGFPVIAEIPLVSRSQNRKGPVLVHSDRDSPPAEAYRSLRSTLLLAPRSRRSVGEVRDRARRHTPRRSADDHAHAIMVVSPSVGEGKSTCVANLAAAFGESGKRVIVLSCDLRRPAIDRYLDAPKDAPGVSEVLADGKDLEAVLCDTGIPGVQILPSGRPISNPGELLTHGEDLLASARRLADIVIVDTPPVLATDDMSAMIPLVDDVVIVCRAGSTGAEAARRSAERLNRLGAPIAGVVIVGAQSLPAVRGYYRSYVSKDAARPRAEAYKPVVDNAPDDDDPRQHPPDQSPA